MSDTVTIDNPEWWIQGEQDNVVPFDGDLLDGADPQDVEFAGLKTSFYMVRHATTKLNEAGRVRGWDDPVLSSLGRDQAKGQAKWFIGKGLAGLESSDLKRALKTARKIAKITGARINEINRVLRSWDLGELQGRLTTDIEPIVQDYVRNRPDTPVVGGESFTAFKARALSAVQKKMLAYQTDGGPPVAQVTHSRNLRMAAAWITLGCPATLQVDLDVFLSVKIPDAGVMQIWLDDTGAWRYRILEVVKETKAD